MSKIHVTRDLAFWKNFLAQQRVKVANRMFNFVPFKGRILDLGCVTYPLLLINTNFMRNLA